MPLVSIGIIHGATASCLWFNALVQFSSGVLVLARVKVSANLNEAAISFYLKSLGQINA